MYSRLMYPGVQHKLLLNAEMQRAEYDEDFPAMNRMKITTTLAVLLYFVQPVGLQAASEQGCGELLESRCQSCHYLSRVCRQLGEKSEKRWRATVKRMVKRRGAKVSVEEQAVLVECLQSKAPEVVAVCEKE